MFKKNTLFIITMLGIFLLLISTVSAADNLTSDSHSDDLVIASEDLDNNIPYADESEDSAENYNLNPKVNVHFEDNFLSFSAPADIFDDLNLWINNVSYGRACDLNYYNGIINDVCVKNKQGEIVSVGNITWSNLKFTLNGKTSILSIDEYQHLKDHNTIQKYVGVKKIKYVSNYKLVNKRYYTTKLLGKAYKSRIGAIILSMIVGVKKTVDYFKKVDKALSKKVNKQIKNMKKKGWKLSYTYKKTKKGIYRIYGEFYKTKKVKIPVYKYKQYNNYMIFKYTPNKYTLQVDSNDGKYVYSKTFELI